MVFSRFIECPRPEPCPAVVPPVRVKGNMGHDNDRPVIVQAIYPGQEAVGRRLC